MNEGRRKREFGRRETDEEEMWGTHELAKFWEIEKKKKRKRGIQAVMDGEIHKTLIFFFFFLSGWDLNDRYTTTLVKIYNPLDYLCNKSSIKDNSVIWAYS